MQNMTLVFLVLCTTSLVLSKPIDIRRQLINRPNEEVLLRGVRSAPTPVVLGVKGGVRVTTPSIRKGEYLCGNKVCKLPAGEPPHCNGVCQYPLALG